MQLHLANRFNFPSLRVWLLFWCRNIRRISVMRYEFISWFCCRWNVSRRCVLLIASMNSRAAETTTTIYLVSTVFVYNSQLLHSHITILISLCQRQSFKYVNKNFYHCYPCFSAIDRELIETRAKLFRDFRNADQKIPDEVYHFDLHSGSYFTESIEARYGTCSLICEKNIKILSVYCNIRKKHVY